MTRVPTRWLNLCCAGTAALWLGLGPLAPAAVAQQTTAPQQSPPTGEAVQAPYVDAERLDTLFAALRVAPDPAIAQRLVAEIWAIWLSPADPDLNQRMQDVVALRNAGDLVSALRLLDAMVVDYPDYAEAWNQRATLYFMTGRYEASLADCGEVLALEPRHFGALAGRALIYLQMDKRALALKDIAAAVALHPFLAEAQLFPELSRPVTRT